MLRPWKLVLVSALLAFAAALSSAQTSDVTVYCVQTKPSSVPGCLTELGVSDTSFATGVWQATKIARPPGAGAFTPIRIFIYSHGIGIGKSNISVNVPIGTLCIGLNGYKDFKRSSPACRAALLPGAFVGCDPGPMETALNCNQNALGLAIGEDVNVQFWYRDPLASGLSNLSSAIFYTVQ